MKKEDVGLLVAEKKNKGWSEYAGALCYTFSHEHYTILDELVHSSAVSVQVQCSTKL